MTTIVRATSCSLTTTVIVALVLTPAKFGSSTDSVRALEDV